MTMAPSARVLLVKSDDESAHEVVAAVEERLRARLTTIDFKDVADTLKNDMSDIVIADISKLGSDEHAMLSTIRAIAPDTPLVVTSGELEADAVRGMLKYNLDDWLRKPLDREEFATAITNAIRARKTGGNRVHAVISTVGGAGATTLAVSMADIASTEMFRKKRPSIALFDLDFSTGNCSYVLNMVNGFNLGSVAAAPRRIDSEFISVIQQKHEHGFYLYSFKRPELATDMNGYELVLRMLDAVSNEHDHTFLDVPYYETEWKEDVLSAVNTVTLVTELNLPALKHTLDVIQRLKGLRGKDFPMTVVINKKTSSLFGGRIGKRKLKELFEDTPFVFLPLDADLFGESLDRGVTPSEVSKRAKFLKSLQKYMASIQLEPEMAK